MPFSLYARNKILDHIHGKTSFTMPTAYVGLSTTTPNGSDGNVTEPSTSGTAYARVTTAGGDWGAASSGAITNANALTFATATGGGWGTVTHVVVYDSATVGAGNLLWWDDITSQAVPAGVTVSIPVGDADSSLS